MSSVRYQKNFETVETRPALLAYAWHWIVLRLDDSHWQTGQIQRLHCLLGNKNRVESPCEK